MRGDLFVTCDGAHNSPVFRLSSQAPCTSGAPLFLFEMCQIVNTGVSDGQVLNPAFSNSQLS